MLRKSLLMISALSLSLLISCASVPDIPVCTEISLSRGWCTNTISDQEFFIDELRPHSFTGKKEDAKTWWELRPYMVYVPFPSWAELKAYIIKQCKRTNCKEYVASWERKIQGLDDKIQNE